MKTIAKDNRHKSALINLVHASPVRSYSAFELENRNDIKNVSSEIQKTIGNDLSKVSIVVIKS